MKSNSRHLSHMQRVHWTHGSHIPGAQLNKDTSSRNQPIVILMICSNECKHLNGEVGDVMRLRRHGVELDLRHVARSLPWCMLPEKWHDWPAITRWVHLAHFWSAQGSIRCKCGNYRRSWLVRAGVSGSRWSRNVALGRRGECGCTHSCPEAKREADLAGVVEK